MKRNVVIATVATAIAITFVGGSFVGYKAKETKTAYADAVQAVGETATIESPTEIPQATNPDCSLPIDDGTETETVPCALNPDSTLPDPTETEPKTVPQATNPDGTLPTETEGTLPDESDEYIPPIESDETETAELDIDSYLNSISDSDTVEIIPSNELTEAMLENRNGKVIIEKMVGVVDDDQGNGHLLNGNDAYVTYDGHVDNFHKGNVVVTYCVYNPESNAIDDVVARADYIVGNANEYNTVSDSDSVKIVPSDQLTEEMLENRNGKIIVEKMVGVVDDDEGNGHLLNGDGYVMYGGHCDCHKGDVVVTYNVYNPESNAIDDVVARTDYVVGNVNQ